MGVLLAAGIFARVLDTWSARTRGPSSTSLSIFASSELSFDLFPIQFLHASVECRSASLPQSRSVSNKHATLTTVGGLEESKVDNVMYKA
jgi:hypothetical protein